MNELQKELIKFNNDRNWGKAHTSKNLAISISIEASELMEIYQWVDDINDEKDKEHLGEEIADIVIYCMNLASKYNMNIEDIIKDKIKKNAIKYPIKK